MRRVRALLRGASVRGAGQLGARGHVRAMLPGFGRSQRSAGNGTRERRQRRRGSVACATLTGRHICACVRQLRATCTMGLCLATLSCMLSCSTLSCSTLSSTLSCSWFPLEGQQLSSSAAHSCRLRRCARFKHALHAFSPRSASVCQSKQVLSADARCLRAEKRTARGRAVKEVRESKSGKREASTRRFFMLWGDGQAGSKQRTRRWRRWGSQQGRGVRGGV